MGFTTLETTFFGKNSEALKMDAVDLRDVILEMRGLI